MIWHLKSVSQPSHSVCSTQVRVRLCSYEVFSLMNEPKCKRCEQWVATRSASIKETK